MATLARQRCFHHGSREAVARCPHCRRFFCRECITEHGHRVICAACLAELADAQAKRRRRLSTAVTILAAALALLFVWGTFALLGRVLLNIPSRYHEGIVWDQRR